MFMSLFSRQHKFVSHDQNCSEMVFILRNMYAMSQSDFNNSWHTYIWTEHWQCKPNKIINKSFNDNQYEIIR